MITTYQSNKILDNLFGATAFTPSGTYYIGLSTTTVNTDGSGVTEPASAEYTRIAITNNKTSWRTAANNTVTNAARFEFPESQTNWGTITDIFIADAATGGNVLYFDELTNARIVQVNSILVFFEDSISIQLV